MGARTSRRDEAGSGKKGQDPASRAPDRRRILAGLTQASHAIPRGDGRRTHQEHAHAIQEIRQYGTVCFELCLGAMTFGGQDGLWGQIGQLQQEEANRLVGRALEAGVNFIDTADVYAEGRSRPSPVRPCAT